MSKKNKRKVKFEEFQVVGSNYLRDYSYKNGSTIYDFMKKYEIGESDYGKLMDIAGKHEAVHRLHGHHIIYDFPVNDPKNVLKFLDHEASDLFTKQGLPIIPGEILENHDLIKYCKSLSHNWNFVNGFDILSATVSIYHSLDKLEAAINHDLSIDSFHDVAKFLGIGSLELAIAFSTANPFLLIGASLRIAGTLKGIANNSAVVFFKQYHNVLTIEFHIATNTVEENIAKSTMDTSIKLNSIESSINKNSL